MTPNAIVNTTILGGAFRGIQVGVLDELVQPRGQKAFDPNLLQEYWKGENPIARSGARHSEIVPRCFGELQKSGERDSSQFNVKVTVVPPADLALDIAARKIIGAGGLSRLREFIGYQSGWDLGQGKPLAPRSVVILGAFLRHLPELEPYRPSLFMTHEGNLELGLEDAGGRSISIEFYPDKIDYYLEGLNEEQTVRVDLIPQLIEKVRSLIS